MKKTLTTFWQQLWQSHPFLMKIGMLNLTIALICFLAMGVDNRTLLGVSVWLKPFKFGVSLAIFCATMAWLLSVYPYSKKGKKRTGNFFAILVIIEILTIVIPAAMGVKSHYNFETPAIAINFLLMGLAIHSTLIGLLIMAIHSFSKNLITSKSMIWAVRFAWLTLFLAFWGGEIMIGQNAHSIGIPDGGDGLPVTNWSTNGGDLRVMHFFGIHALQILPLLVYFLGQTTVFKSAQKLTWVSILLGISYLSFTGLLFYQALQGKPFLSVAF